MASATWRRPAQRVSFIFGDGQRNLATAAQRVSFIFGNGQRNCATARAICQLQVIRNGARPVQRATFVFDFVPVHVFGNGQRNLSTARSTRIFHPWRRPAQLGDGRAIGSLQVIRNGARPVQRATFNLCLRSVSCLWRRPAQPGDGPLNAYFSSLATASVTWRRPRNAYLLSLVTASATWRRPAQFVNSK